MTNYKRRNKNRADTNRKLNGMFDDMFKNMGPGANGPAGNVKQDEDTAKRIRKEFDNMFRGGPSKPAGDPPAVNKKDLDPIDRKILGLKNIIADPGASEGEKASARKILKKLEAKKAGR